VLLLFRRIVVILYEAVESVQARRRLRLTAGNLGRIVSLNFLGFLGFETNNCCVLIWLLFNSNGSYLILMVIGIDSTNHTMGRDNGPIQGAGVNCESFSICEASPSYSVGEVEIGSSKLPSNISSRVRYRKWNFYAVRRGRTVGIFRTLLECERQVKY
jgi:hypothetical protein